MKVLPFFLFFMTVVCIISKTVGMNFYWPTYPAKQDIFSVPQLIPLPDYLNPDCYKNNKNGKGENGSTKEGSSEESKKESEEGNGSTEKSSEEKGNGSSAEDKKETKSSEENGNSSDEDSKKKKNIGTKYIFPPRTYVFPPRQVQPKATYTALAPYPYLPYQNTYIAQQPFSASLSKTSYQYFSMPTAAVIPKTYGAAVSSVKNPLVSRFIYSSPVVSYPATSKQIISPAVQVYPAPASWKNAVSNLVYYKT